MPRISAAEAGQIIMAEQRQLNQPNLPRTPQLMNDLTGKGVFHVCNVGPWSYHIERGARYLDIPAYDPETHKNGCAMSKPMPAVCQEAIITGGGGIDGPLIYSYIFDDGYMVAREMIGVGFGLPKDNALVQYGVFVPAASLPTKEEIGDANRELELYADRLIQEARSAFDSGPKEWERTKSDRHLWAGRKRGIQERWVTESHREQSVRCEMCGKHNPEGIAKCQCGNIIDFELYRRIEEKQREMMEDLATTPKRK